jgi:hypothetical protein
MMNKTFKAYALYYGFLQSLHVCLLFVSGLIFLRTGNVGFLALPPAAGWSDQVIPFLLGLGIADAIAAGMGIAFVYRGFIRKTWHFNLGLASISIALASALIYLVGTLSAGAWSQNPMAYIVMVILFSPVPLLYLSLFRKVMDKKTS